MGHFNLGVCCAQGIGVPADQKLALQWYMMAAEKVHSPSQAEVGRFYEDGLSVERDESKALEWYIKAGNNETAQKRRDFLQRKNAAECSDAAAQFWLCDYFKRLRKDEEAVKWCSMAGEQGNADAQCWLFEHYKSCGDGEQTLKWGNLAGEQGSAHFQFKLFEHNELLGDDEQAFKWCALASKRGHNDAAYHLGKCYARGRGVRYNEELADLWYAKAAKEWHDKAQEAAGRFLHKRARNGDVKAQFKYGQWFFQARGDAGEL